VTGDIADREIPLGVVIADDEPAVVEALVDRFRLAGIAVVGRAIDAEEALAKIELHRPDVAVVDVGLPRDGGIVVARRAAELAPGTAIVLYSQSGGRGVITDALDAGVLGVVLKESPIDDLIRAVRSVAGGVQYVDPVLAGAFAVAAVDGSPQLTRREREVIRGLAAGMTSEAIGRRLSLSTATVRTHERKALAKLGATSRVHAVAVALRRRLIT